MVIVAMKYLENKLYDDVNGLYNNVIKKVQVEHIV